MAKVLQSLQVKLKEGQQRYREGFVGAIASGRIAEVRIAVTDFGQTSTPSAQVTTRGFEAEIFGHTREGFKYNHSWFTPVVMHFHACVDFHTSLARMFLRFR